MRSRGTPAAVLICSILLCFPASRAAASGSDDPEILFWSGLLGSVFDTAVEILGPDFREIDPGSVQSTADRIIWYPGGLTLWFSSTGLSQIRFDRSVQGSAAGISIGSTKNDIRAVFGEPWIESDDSLYYNLPWQRGPVRLRCVFGSGTQPGLTEAYLYRVR